MISKDVSSSAIFCLGISSKERGYKMLTSSPNVGARRKLELYLYFVKF